MEKKLPNMFANKIDRRMINNERVVYTKSDERTNSSEYLKKDVKMDGKNINQKLQQIFNSPNYVYKADVVITLRNGKINKKVIGKNNTHLITIENELIPISDIINIEYFES